MAALCALAASSGAACEWRGVVCSAEFVLLPDGSDECAVWSVGLEVPIVPVVLLRRQSVSRPCEA